MQTTPVALATVLVPSFELHLTELSRTSSDLLGAQPGLEGDGKLTVQAGVQTEMLLQ